MESNDGFIILTSTCYRANDEAWLTNHVIEGNFSCSRPFAFFSRPRKDLFFFHCFQERTANLPFVQEDNVNTTLQASYIRKCLDGHEK